MSRPMWKGELLVGAASMSVRILPAGDSPDKVTFNQAHRCSATKFARLQQKRWCPGCKKEVPHAELTRVYEHADGQYLEVTDEELSTCEPTIAKAFIVDQLLERPLDPLFIDGTAVLVPDGPGAEEPFETLRSALGSETAIGHAVIQKRHVRLALQASNLGITVFLLRTFNHVQQMLDQSSYTRPRPVHTNVTLMRRRLQDMEQDFMYSQLRDHYSVSVQKMLTTKLSTQVKADLKASLTTKKRRRSA